MPRKPLPPHILEQRGSYVKHPERRPKPDAAPLPTPVTRLAEERPEVVQPAPATLQDARATRLWEELSARLIARGALTQDGLRSLERLCLLTTAMWRAAEAGRLPTAALSREIGNLERQLGLAADASSEAPRGRSESRWAQLKRRAEAHDTFVRTDPEGWAESCRRDAAKLDIDDPELDRLLEDDEYFGNDDQVVADDGKGDEPT